MSQGSLSPVDRQVLSVGTISGAWPLSAKRWTAAVRSVSLAIEATRGGFSAPVSVNVEFHVESDVFHPEFSGLRAGAFRKRDQLLKIQVALVGEPPDDPEAEILRAMIEAVGEATRWATRRKVQFDSEPLLAVIALAAARINCLVSSPASVCSATGRSRPTRGSARGRSGERPRRRRTRGSSRGGGRGRRGSPGRR